MRQPLWQRLRRDRESTDPSADTVEAIDDGSAVRGPAPVARQPDPAEIRSLLHLDREVVAPPSDRSAAPGVDELERTAAYAAWAGRMRTRRQEKLASIEPESETDARAASSTAGYWDAETLFKPTARTGPGAPTLLSNIELLGLLELTESANSHEITLSYRRLAKEHHPDRWLDASPDEQETHRARMVEVSGAYKVLRERGR